MIRSLLVLALMFPVLARAGVRVVPSVDIERYLGTWYEMASIKQPFQRDCVCTQAVYAKDAEGRFTVENSCRWGGVSGERRVAQGFITVPDPAATAKLSVKFSAGGAGDYWIFFLDPEYRVAGVTNATGTSLWILSRRRAIGENLLRSVLEEAKLQGIDVSRATYTGQGECEGVPR